MWLNDKMKGISIGFYFLILVLTRKPVGSVSAYVVVIFFFFNLDLHRSYNAIGINCQLV